MRLYELLWLVLIEFLDSGMKEDLSLFGNELNYANAVWSAAYVIGQVPSNLLLTRVSHQSILFRLLLKQG